MQELRFDKMFISSRLKENRKRHEEIYKEAVEGYQKKAIALLGEKLEKVRGNAIETIAIHLPVPQNHLKEYDRVILMVEQCLDIELLLDEQEYAQFIQDNWDWTRNFYTSNSNYSQTAASGCLSL